VEVDANEELEWADDCSDGDGEEEEYEMEGEGKLETVDGVVVRGGMSGC
jgi:hypothetical protein